MYCNDAFLERIKTEDPPVTLPVCRIKQKALKLRIVISKESRKELNTNDDCNALITEKVLPYEMPF